MTALSCFLSAKISRASGSNCAFGIGLRTLSRSTTGIPASFNCVMLIDCLQSNASLARSSMKLPAREHPSASEVKKGCNHKKRQQGEKVGVRAGKERIVSFGPGRDCFVRIAERADHKGDDDAGYRAAGDVAAGQQYTGAPVAFRNEVGFLKIVLAQRAAHPAIHDPAHQATYKY